MNIEYRTCLPIVYVEFHDHLGDDSGGWLTLDFIKANVNVGNCRAVGFLISEDDISLTISMLYGELAEGYEDSEQANTPLTIVKSTIMFQTILESRRETGE